jgi:hypothetical protein
MPTPGELRLTTLRELRATRKLMLSGPWKVFIEAQPPARQREASAKASEIELAIQALQQAALADIRDKLAANEKELLNGTAALAKARANLAKLQTVLEVVGSLLTIVGRIAKFVV